MIVESNQIFNLMDTNGRRSDVLNALKIYLEILEELKEVYPTESWGTYPDSLSQFLFYEKALEKSKDVFKIHSNYDNFISELGDDYQTFIDRDGQWIENNIAKFAKVLDEAIEKRARHYTSNLVKMGFTDSNRSITEAGYSYLRGSVIRDDLEEILPLDNVNIVLLRQLSKLKIFSSSREGKRQYYSPFILALVLLLDEKTIEEHTFEIIVQGLSPYSSDEVKEAIRSNSIGVDELEASIRDLDISIPDELIGKIDIEYDVFKSIFKGSKSNDSTSKTYYDFFCALKNFRDNITEETYADLINCLDAQIKANKNKKIESPEKDATPDYYRNSTYHAWFKFTSITECVEDELRNYSYVNVDSLFSEGEVNYTCFDNKQIYSIKELIQQERTVWFVRESKDTDSQNEIVLLNSDYVQPNNFSKKYFQSHGSSLLWLSDLHLADSDFSVDNDETTKSLFEHIQGCLSNVQDEIGGLIITGDITSTAEKNGFEKATKLIDDLSRNYVFTNENIAICPGNHDFKFSQKDLDVDEKPKAVSKLYTKAYSNFYKSVYNISPNEYYCCGKKILLSSGHVVEIVALNSLYLQQHQNFNGHGYLSEKQLNFVATEMGWNNKKARNVIRIVMMHHHYLPVCYTEAIDVKRASSVVYDADRLMNWMIKHDVKVLLHGHKHKSIVAQVTYPDTSFSNENNETQMKKISVIGMGGTGCKHTQNLFGTLGFDDNKLYIKFYQIYSDESSEDSEYQTIVLPLER